ncbi:hypothetical protein BJ138DRAFT_1172790 [Hygrophoropsis aurantiaca]|uniref:Uncharacterized protein n=1 Tax=Hygrophoropsis aurantiaca TaxID=72124 RepID=A0ACB8AC99_9AGAM|nr:hypothetical protein BJ138DRAFT_1172790 [Hygrophoropsis aurantiaca]
MMFPPPTLLSSRKLILISDEVAAPGDFLLHRFLSTHLKEDKNSRCIILSVSEEFERWKAIAAKSNLNISQSISEQKLVFIDVLAKVQPALHSEENHSNDALLLPIYELLSSVLTPVASQDRQKVLVILDDITVLEWLGFSLVDLTRFTRALRNLCMKVEATLIIRCHIVNAPEIDSLLQHLFQLSSYHIEVKPLASGRSGAVSGEVCLHLGPVEEEPNIPLVSRAAAVQYRLTDSGAIFFEKGTSGGVL